MPRVDNDNFLVLVNISHFSSQLCSNCTASNDDDCGRLLEIPRCIRHFLQERRHFSLFSISGKWSLGPSGKHDFGEVDRTAAIERGRLGTQVHLQNLALDKAIPERGLVIEGQPLCQIRLNYGTDRRKVVIEERPLVHEREFDAMLSELLAAVSASPSTTDDKHMCLGFVLFVLGGH